MYGRRQAKAEARLYGNLPVIGALADSLMHDIRLKCDRLGQSGRGVPKSESLGRVCSVGGLFADPSRRFSAAMC